jgi:putative (di)nucleoside polyphosphate hydrolase
VSQYRSAVGAAIVNEFKEFFVGHSARADEWQFPQGGILPGESPQTAVLREVKEETGLDGLVIQALGQYEYVWPKKMYADDVIGQQVNFFLIKSESGTKPIKLAPSEFDDYKWVTLSALPWDGFSLVKMKMYRQVIEQCEKWLTNEIQHSQ